MIRQLPLRIPLDDAARQADFVGPAARLAADAEGLVLVSGDHGCGKSHLLQGLCRESMCREKMDREKMGRDSCGGDFLYIPSLKNYEPGVLEGLETRSLICLDEVHEVMGDEAWEVALFHLINGVLHHGGKLVLASRLPVADLPTQLADLASRLKAAALVLVRQPDDAGKLEVIRRKARRRGFEMSDEVCRFILGRARRDMHHLVRLVETLDGESMRNQKRVTIPFVKQALGL